MADDTLMIPKERYDQKNAQYVQATSEIAALKAQLATEQAKAGQLETLTQANAALQQQHAAATKALADYTAIAEHFPAHGEAQHMIAQHAKAMEGKPAAEQVDLASWAAHAVANPSYVADPITQAYLRDMAQRKQAAGQAPAEVPPAQPPVAGAGQEPPPAQPPVAGQPPAAAAPPPAPGLPPANNGVIQAAGQPTPMTVEKMNELARNPAAYKQFKTDHPAEFKQMLEAANNRS